MLDEHAELSREESDAVRRVVLPVLLTGTDGVTFEPLGTCWVFATLGRKVALAISARHTFDYVVRAEGRHERSSPSLPPDFQPARLPPVQLQLSRLRAAFFTGGGLIELATINRIFQESGHDLVVCELELPADAKGSFDTKMELFTGPVSEGVAIQVGGYARLAETQVTTPTDGSAGLVAVVNPMVTFRGATVTKAYDEGRPGGPPGPCFEVDLEAPHGMSGGPILHRAYSPRAVACGIVSRANAFEDGLTVCSNLWPLYAMQLPYGPGGTNTTLVDAVQQGLVVDKADGPSHFEWISQDGRRGGTIHWK